MGGEKRVRRAETGGQGTREKGQYSPCSWVPDVRVRTYTSLRWEYCRRIPSRVKRGCGPGLVVVLVSGQRTDLELPGSQRGDWLVDS